MGIGQNVQALRERRGLTFDAVAKAVGTDAQAISQMEKRKSRTSNFAAQLASFFQVDLEELLSDDFDIDAALSRAPAAASPPATYELEWTLPVEHELLSLFRACGELEKGSIMAIARSLPKAIRHEGGRNNET